MFKKELNQIPLDVLYQELTEASSSVKNAIIEDALKLHRLAVDRRIQAIYSNREDSYEGDAEADFPFTPPDREYIASECALARKKVFAKFAETHKLTTHTSWLMPQLTAHIANIPLAFTAEGKVDSVAYSKQFQLDDFSKGIWALCTHPLRGDIITKQYAPEGRNYCALVPLLLMPHKKFNNINYSRWDTKGLSTIIDPNLYNAMTCGLEFNDTVAEIISVRNKGLTVMSGKTAGNIRNAQSTHKLYSIEGEYKTMPWLAQVMYFQIWCAHPTNRTSLMVLDWKDWDNIPEAIVAENVFIDSEPKVTKPIFTSKPTDSLGWD